MNDSSNYTDSQNDASLPAMPAMDADQVRQWMAGNHPGALDASAASAANAAYDMPQLDASAPDEPHRGRPVIEVIESAPSIDAAAQNTPDEKSDLGNEAIDLELPTPQSYVDAIMTLGELTGTKPEGWEDAAQNLEQVIRQYENIFVTSEKCNLKGYSKYLGFVGKEVHLEVHGTIGRTMIIDEVFFIAGEVFAKIKRKPSMLDSLTGSDSPVAFIHIPADWEGCPYRLRPIHPPKE